jgi:ferrochelatase
MVTASRRQPADGADARLDDRSYDALIVVSFGGPEGPDDVIPFLENVTRGRNIPRERLEEVGHHYELFGGVSPINGQNRALIAALETELAAHGIELPIYFGNRNWAPYLADTLAEMRDAGVRRALAFFTSAFSSYSGCRQYRENIYEAQLATGPDAPEVLKLRTFYNHPGFIEANADRVRDALAQVPEERRASTPIVFTAHSIPSAMAEQCRYADQLAETSRLVAEAVGADYSIVLQSRSG